MPTTELSLQNDLSATPQNVQDEKNTQSALLISTNGVQIKAPAGAPAGATLFLEAAAATGTAPSVVMHSNSSESAIRFTTTTNDQAIHIGLGGNAGVGTFFVFTKDAGVVFKIAQDGTVSIDKKLIVGGTTSLDGAQLQLRNVPNATTVLKHLMIDPATGKVFAQ